jgi:transposase-like protein
LVYLWRAVDAEGEVLDVLVQTRRNKQAALKLMRKLLKKYGFMPDKLVTDDLRSYGAPPLGAASNHKRPARLPIGPLRKLGSIAYRVFPARCVLAN